MCSGFLILLIVLACWWDIALGNSHEFILQDDCDNVTRFLMLAREPIIPGTDRPFKVRPFWIIQVLTFLLNVLSFQISMLHITNRACEINVVFDFIDKYSVLIRGGSWSAFQGTCCICFEANQPYKGLFFHLGLHVSLLFITPFSFLKLHLNVRSLDKLMAFLCFPQPD